MYDAAHKGRMGARLNAEIVAEIRALRDSLSQTKLAARYGISQSHVSRILRNKVW
jgi:DNA-directed RNA polymerase specialized sigma subunit